jgi:hypothetical protein
MVDMAEKGGFSMANKVIIKGSSNSVEIKPVGNSVEIIEPAVNLIEIMPHANSDECNLNSQALANLPFSANKQTPTDWPGFTFYSVN